jgi:hypothetical protein
MKYDEDDEKFFEVLYADLPTERVDAIKADEFLERILIKARDLGFHEGFAHGLGDGSLATGYQHEQDR